jgi:hypothetical protein
MDALTVVGIFMVGASSGAILGLVKSRSAQSVTEPTSNAFERWANDLLTTLGAPLDHPEQRRALTTDERVQWLQARNG